jgi:integrase
MSSLIFVKPHYQPALRAYLSAVHDYLIFCSQSDRHSHHAPPHPAAYQELDSCVSCYLAYLYNKASGKRRYAATNTIFGIYLCLPMARGELTVSQQALDGWSRLRPASSHPPLTWPLTLLIAATMANNGYPQGCLAMLVAFDSLLRISELVGLKVCDVSGPLDLRRGSSISNSSSSVPASLPSSRVCLRLASTKTGSNQWAELYDSHIGELLLNHIHDKPKHQSVFDLRVSASQSNGARAFRSAMSAVCDSLGIAQCGFSPHSLRHGGATHAIMHMNQSVETVLLRGRWASSSSARIYLQSGRAALLQQSLPSHILPMAQALQANWYREILQLLQRIT